MGRKPHADLLQVIASKNRKSECLYIQCLLKIEYLNIMVYLIAIVLLYKNNLASDKKNMKI